MLFVWQTIGLLAVGQEKFIDEGSLRLRASSSSESGMGLEQVAALHLFGDAVTAQAAAPPVPTEMPKTNLKLVLVGAMTNSDPKKASALISADNQSRRYSIGDNVAGGAVLHEVLSDSVVLLRDGRYETLFFPRTSDVPVVPALRNNRAGDAVRKGSVGEINSSPTNGGAKDLSLRERLNR
jgi:type II secretion system protein C